MTSRNPPFRSDTHHPTRRRSPTSSAPVLYRFGLRHVLASALGVAEQIDVSSDRIFASGFARAFSFDTLDSHRFVSIVFALWISCESPPRRRHRRRRPPASAAKQDHRPSDTSSSISRCVSSPTKSGGLGPRYKALRNRVGPENCPSDVSIDSERARAGKARPGCQRRAMESDGIVDEIL